MNTISNSPGKVIGAANEAARHPRWDYPVSFNLGRATQWFARFDKRVEFVELLKSKVYREHWFSCLRHILAILGIVFGTQAFGQWDPPPGYYSNATGTGSTLKGQLESAMTVGHIQGRYGDFRFSAAIHDQDPSNPDNIRLVYNGASVDSAWDSGATWNREHVWPQSRQPGNASNSSTGNLGDPHAIRPSNPGVNSSRGNNPFGFGDTTGSFGNNNGFWYPGDDCRGDIARSLFYSDTRWSSLGLSLVNGSPSGNQMGDLESLVAWHYLDPPDEFERRRNHTIFSSSENPLYFTNNRNAYVDRPEFVWSIYVGQDNDSAIVIEDGQVFSDGSSILNVDFGEVIVGSNIDTSIEVTLSKSGLDGTYFCVTCSGSATSNREGSHNAFPVGFFSSQEMTVTLNYDSNTIGTYNGSVVIDNLDVTSAGGIGKGSNDGDDLINLSINVVEPFVLGDVNCDGELNLLDVGPFVAAVGAGLYSEKADINADGEVNLLDVDLFIALFE